MADRDREGRSWWRRVAVAGRRGNGKNGRNGRNGKASRGTGTASLPPKFVRENQWTTYPMPIWPREKKDEVTILYNFVERRKSYFLRAYMKRKGYRFIDMGDHVKEDVRWGKLYGNRMECNPMYFTSGSLIRHLVGIQQETGLTKQEIVDRYVFLGGGGQCGPCRYGMYPQEYLKVVNEAGFEGFRIMIFSSDLSETRVSEDSAFQFDLEFRVNIMLAALLADLMHIAECALRSHALDRDSAMAILAESEEEILEAFSSPAWQVTVPAALRRVGDRLATIPQRRESLPLIFVTGEFFANLAHNDGNYHLRRFICEEGCEPIPGLMINRILYDNWRRKEEALRGIRYARDAAEASMYRRSLRKQKNSTAIITWYVKLYSSAMRPERFGAQFHLMDHEALAQRARNYYHPHIFGGEGNLEIAEALYHADKVDGFITVKPFGCMPSSGVSDGVQAKILAQHPGLNYLSIETSGDNDVSILSRVSMLLFKSKKKLARDLASSRELTGQHGT